MGKGDTQITIISVINKNYCLSVGCFERPQLETHRRHSWKSVNKAQTQKIGGRKDEIQEIKIGCAKNQRFLALWGNGYSSYSHLLLMFQGNVGVQVPGLRRGRGNGNQTTKGYEAFFVSHVKSL